MISLNKHSKVKVESEKKPMTLFFVRHGESTGQCEAASSNEDPSLTEKGRKQAVQIGKRLSSIGFDHIYCSDLARTRETCDEIMKLREESDLTVTDEIREVSNAHTALGPATLRPEDREHVEKERDVMERFANVLRHNHEPGERLLIVSHGNMIRALLSVLSGCNPRESVLLEVFNTSLSVLDIWQGGVAILTLGNCVRHLARDEITV